MNLRGAAVMSNQCVSSVCTQEPERTLDIFNITLGRQQAEMEVRSAGGG